MSVEECIERARKKQLDTRCKLFYAIHQVLLLHQSPIHEFTLLMESDSTCFELDQTILHLSMNHTLKKLTLDFEESNEALYVLPLSVFSLHHLTDMYLSYCDVNLKRTFNGFALGSLTSLTFNKIIISQKALLRLLSNCPSLKSFTLILEDHDFDCKKSCIMELFKCLPVIERLTIWSYIIRPLVLPSVPKGLPLLIHLKYICIEELSFGDGYGLTFLCVLLKCSPNMETIKLEIETDDESSHLDSDELKEYSVILEDYSDVWLEHMNELEILFFRDDELELEFKFVKYILARSPNLKKVKLDTHVFNRNQKMELRKTLKLTPRASPAKVVFEICWTTKDLMTTIRSLNLVGN